MNTKSAVESNTSYSPHVTMYDENGNINKEQYEKDLSRRQEEHLRNVRNNYNDKWRPCLHDGCPECIGTGVKKDGSVCIHNISCPCPRCNKSLL
jgi:hypothetical protein